ncbi:hypothetical protein [Litoribacter populi]|uniref:hypothetical protein n=1 Tax=Litoribacter populi TaxID=2598460 RepID=UPI0011802B00|nr:hypothetical protein [Litoribacter populi]
MLRKFCGVALCAIALSSCTSDDQKDYNEVFVPEILEIAPVERIQQLERMNFIMHEGKTPPQVSGSFKASPYYMTASNEQNWTYQSGERVEDYYYRFREQNMSDLSVVMDVRGVDPEFDNIVYDSPNEKRYMSGNGNKFSAFSIVENYYVYHERDRIDTARFRSLEVVSAEVSDEGLRNYQYAFVMLDNYGDPLNKLAQNDATRIFYDGDRLAEAHPFHEGEMEDDELGVRRKFRPLERQDIDQF